MLDHLAAVPPWLWVPALFVIVSAAMVGAVVLGLRDPSPAPPRRPPVPADHRKDPVPAAAALDPTDPYGGLPEGHLLVPAPTAETRDGRVVPLGDWLRRETGREGVWVDVVAEFYRRAAAAPAVADYFAGVHMDRLQRHFVAALVMVTGRGMTVGTVRRMTAAHTGVRDSAGHRITDDTWAAVVGTLVDVLAEHQVPAATLRQLGAAVAPLRAAIVTAPC